VDRKLMANCPITRTDIKMAEDVYGTSVAHLKGKTVQRKGQHVTFAVATLPITIANKYKLVTLCGDIFYINGIQFFSTISRHINFPTAAHINDAKRDTLKGSLKAIKGSTFPVASRSTSYTWTDNLSRSDSEQQLWACISMWSLTRNTCLKSKEASEL
jgi:hypothetical protein